MKRLSKEQGGWLSLAVFGLALTIIGIAIIPDAVNKIDRQQVNHYNQLLAHYNNGAEIARINVHNLTLSFEGKKHDNVLYFDEKEVKSQPKLFKPKVKDQLDYAGSKNVIHYELKDINLSKHHYFNTSLNGVTDPYTLLEKHDRGIIIGIYDKISYETRVTQALNGIYLMSITNPLFYLYGELGGRFTINQSGWIILGIILLIFGFLSMCLGIIFTFVRKSSPPPSEPLIPQTSD